MKYNDNSKNKLDLAKNNHIFQAPRIWNELIPKIINNYSPNKTGIMEPGSAKESDHSRYQQYWKK